MNIDALTRRELDAAVAVELGAKWCIPYHSKPICKALYLPADAATRTEAPDWVEVCGIPNLYIPHYSENISAAWELDGDEWEWDFSEHPDELIAYVHDDKSDPMRTSARVKLSDFLTKAEAYATARCRAWLRARKAMKEQDNG